MANYFGGGELLLLFWVSMKSNGNLLEIYAQLYCLCLLQPQVHDNSIRWLVWLWTRTAEFDPYICKPAFISLLSFDSFLHLNLDFSLTVVLIPAKKT